MFDGFGSPEKDGFDGWHGVVHGNDVGGGENLKRATESGDFIESLGKEMKVLADEIDWFLEVAPDITMIRILAGDEYLPCFALILQQYYKDHKFAKLKWV